MCIKICGLEREEVRHVFNFVEFVLSKNIISTVFLIMSEDQAVLSAHVFIIMTLAQNFEFTYTLILVCRVALHMYPQNLIESIKHQWLD